LAFAKLNELMKGLREPSPFTGQIGCSGCVHWIL